MKNKISTWLNYVWYEKSYWRFALWPLSFVYQLIILVRKVAYQIGICKSTQFSVPVIVVGNITVGGTGKTPLVIELVKQLAAKGYNPGVVSRGYGGHAKTYPIIVTNDSDPKATGDEPLLIAKKTQCPVVVSPNRVDAVTKLLEDFNCDLVISDDGLQHDALARDIEIVVIDSQRRFGNGYCLPAGPLREPMSRLKTVDIVVEKGQDFILKPGSFYQLLNPENKCLASTFSTKVHAVTGIANPARFFNLLRHLGLDIIEHPFPDHHLFTMNELEFGDSAPILLTEKDAVKCQLFATKNYWVLPVDVEINSNLINMITDKLGELHEKLLHPSPT